MKKTSIGGKYITKAERPNYYIPVDGSGGGVELVVGRNKSGKAVYKLRRPGTNKYIGDGWRTRAGAVNYARKYHLDLVGG